MFNHGPILLKRSGLADEEGCTENRRRWDGDAYGATAPNQNPDGDSIADTLAFRMPGQIFDTESNTFDNGFRTYSPDLGAYRTQSDPIGLAGGSWSTYTYVNGNPIKYVDPLGLAPSLCDCRKWHDMKLAEKVAALEAEGYNVATDVAIRLLSANSTSFARADYVANRSGSPIYRIGEIKTGNARLSKAQLANYGDGLVQIVGEKGIPLGLDPGEFILAEYLGVDRFPGCPE